MSAHRDYPPAPAPYRADFTRSRGRRWAEPESRSRTPFARDRDRIIHASAFRRLKEKTQVFVAHEGDHFRTRLTHSLEVAQIARSIARALGLDDDLAEAIALAHDLGHPAFGHAGEEQLDECMHAFGGFDHNVQTFRVVTELERRYPAFAGLNLTWEMLEGVVKHNGPVSDRLNRPSWRAVAEYDRDYPLETDGWASAEAQVAALADDIAYNNHDVDDGVQAGLFDMDELAETPLIGPVIRAARQDYPGLEPRLLRLEAVRRMIGVMVDDVMATTLDQAKASGVDSPEAVRALGKPLVAFSPDMAEDLLALREFLHTRMYRHYRVNRTRSQARRVLREMFDLFLREPDVLPGGWADQVRSADGQAARALVVCDYIAGMTDRFAIEEHRKLFNLDLWNP
jgi:dGTPase